MAASLIVHLTLAIWKAVCSIVGSFKSNILVVNVLISLDRGPKYRNKAKISYGVKWMNTFWKGHTNAHNTLGVLTLWWYSILKMKFWQIDTLGQWKQLYINFAINVQQEQQMYDWILLCNGSTWHLTVLSMYNTVTWF